VERYGQEPWLVGSVMTETTLESALDRIGRAVGGGVLVLLVSLLGAWALGRWFTNRMRDIAGAAGSIRQLELGNAPRLPASRVRELDDTASAFNAMIDGLRWFETYVPRSLVRRLLRFGDQAVESVERDVTVMFTDLAGFTTLSERMGAAEVATFLNEHFALVDACIEAEDGTVDKHLGDGVMAFWGAPEDQPDHAVRAVRAALAIRAALTADNERRRAAGLKVARTRIGIQTGPVTVGNIGAASRVSYTIVGDSVNAASRLEDLGRTVEDAGDVVILVGDDTAVALGGLFTLRPMGKHKLRGRKGDTDVFEVMGPAG
jgi:adenylate cyclase